MRLAVGPGGAFAQGSGQPQLGGEPLFAPEDEGGPQRILGEGFARPLMPVGEGHHRAAQLRLEVVGQGCAVADEV